MGERTLQYGEISGWASTCEIFIPTASIYATSISGFLDLLQNGVLSLEKFINYWFDTLVKETGAYIIHGSNVLPKDVVKASGHLDTFTDPYVQCKKCNLIYRADKLVEEILKTKIVNIDRNSLNEIIRQKNIRCIKCGGELSEVKDHNLMMPTYVDVVAREAYLRPEACQTIYLDFIHIYQRIQKLPLAIAQIGYAYRNEISPRRAFIRAREFRQMDIEIFFDPLNPPFDNRKWELLKNTKINIVKENGEEATLTAEKIEEEKIASKFIAYYIALVHRFLSKIYGSENVRFRVLGREERPFYAEFACDVEVFDNKEWIEVMGFHYRTDYDLKRHSEFSNTDLSVTLPNGRRFIPHILELSFGCERPWFVLISQRLVMVTDEETGRSRTVLKIPPLFAPYTVAVFPLLSRPELVNKAKEIFEYLNNYYRFNKYVNVFYNDRGSIGSRYHAADRIGIPFAITIDYKTLEDDTVTLRYRDTRKQDRIKINEIPKFIEEHVLNERYFNLLIE